MEISNSKSRIGVITEGLFATLGVLISIFVVPRIMFSLIDDGPSIPGLIILLSAILLCLFASLLVYFSPKVKFILYIGSILLLGSLGLLIGLLYEFEIDGDSIPTMVVFSLMFLVCFLFISLGLQVGVNPINDNGIGDKSIENKWKSNMWLYLITLLLGLSIPWIVYSIAAVNGRNSNSWIFYSIGMLAFLNAIFVVISQKTVLERKQAETWLKSVGLRMNDFVLALLFGLYISIFFFSALFTPSPFIGFSFVGVAVGFMIYSFLGFFSKKFLTVIESVGLFAYLLVFQLDWETLSTAPSLFGLGIFLGLILCEILSNLRHFISRRQYAAGFWLLIAVGLVIGGSFLGYEMKWVVRDNADQIWLVSLIWLAVVLLIAILKILAAATVKINRQINRSQESDSDSPEKNPGNRAEVPFLDFSPRAKRGIIALSLCLIVVMPITVGVLYSESNISVRIDLGKTMYTVNGDPVSVVYLKDRTAIILFDSPNPTGIAYDEIIRPAKSVRLGAYFYGLDDSTVDDLVDWIGHNMDVFSLGMCGDTVTPENISSIRGINPLVKFYYMAFATTLFEGNGQNNTWGGSHYPSMEFNETMHDWTVKLKNGTEAMGVRRDSPTSSAHLMDLGRMEWADYFAWIYSNRSAQFHADGVAIDEVMWRGYWNVDTEDLRDYDDLDEIIDTCYAWLERLDSKTDMEIITQAFWPEAQQYQDGCWGEIAFRSGGQYGDRVDDHVRDVWYESLDWEGIVNNVVDVAGGNRSYIWAAWYERDNTEALEYSIATYLMGKPNNCKSLVFHPHPIYDGGYPNNLAGYSLSTVISEVEKYPEYFDLEMGDALGAMEKIQGDGGDVWKREFTNGIVLVNPYHAHVPGF